MSIEQPLMNIFIPQIRQRIYHLNDYLNFYVNYNIYSRDWGWPRRPWPKAGRKKQKTERKKEEEKNEKKTKVGDNNGQATHGARMADASRLGQNGNVWTILYVGGGGDAYI